MVETARIIFVSFVSRITKEGENEEIGTLEAVTKIQDCPVTDEELLEIKKMYADYAGEKIFAGAEIKEIKAGGAFSIEIPLKLKKRCRWKAWFRKYGTYSINFLLRLKEWRLKIPNAIVGPMHDCHNQEE